MARILPPPAERFDPITARWLTPGGPLHDPQRDSLDPDHGEPVRVVEPVPRELAEADESSAGGAREARNRQLLVLAVVALAAGMIVGGFVVGWP
ncbi:hypothetical protein PROP_01459 [Propionicimonas sp. T2.31MG-18]|uniref:hypothetical protein n=1 Tax=Propionicimonas sp. T2.31MG-18 TaxID=3157620 RepID=UPI0035E7695B